MRAVTIDELIYFEGVTKAGGDRVQSGDLPLLTGLGGRGRFPAVLRVRRWGVLRWEFCGGEFGSAECCDHLSVPVPEQISDPFAQSSVDDVDRWDVGSSAVCAFGGWTG